MFETLAILCLPGGYYPYVLVGWCKCKGGFEWEIQNARIIRRFGNNAQLSQLAKNGPQSDTHLLDPINEFVFRPNVRRFIPCNIEAWETHCPKP